MNIMVNKQYWKFGLYNVNFFGYGRHGIEAKNIDGQYEIILDIENFKFAITKIGGYYNLVSYGKEFPINYLKLNDAELKCVNDLIYDMYSRSEPYSFDMIHHEPNIRFIENKYFDLTNIIWNDFYPARISTEITYGDIVIDKENNEEFVVKYFHDLKYMNKNDNYILKNNIRV